MVVVEEQHNQEPERGGDKYPLNFQIPEVDQPPPRLRGMEGFGSGDPPKMSTRDIPTNIREAYPEDSAELRARMCDVSECGLQARGSNVRA